MRGPEAPVREIRPRERSQIGRNFDRNFTSNTRSYIAVRKCLRVYFHGFSQVLNAVVSRLEIAWICCYELFVFAAMEPKLGPTREAGRQ